MQYYKGCIAIEGVRIKWNKKKRNRKYSMEGLYFYRLLQVYGYSN